MIWLVAGDFSRTAIALGSSAIVKVSGQNCFRTLSLVLWGRSVLGPQTVPRKVPPRFRQGPTKVPTRVHQGSTEVPPRFHQGCASLFISLVFWGRSSCAAKRFRGRFHQGCASFVISLVFWGRSVLGCHKVLWKVPPSLL